MNILSHYSKRPGKVFCPEFPTPPDNEHKPGGLWLSDDNEFGWYALVRQLMRRGATGWRTAPICCGIGMILLLIRFNLTRFWSWVRQRTYEVS